MMSARNRLIAPLAWIILIAAFPARSESRAEDEERNRGLFDLGLKNEPQRARNTVLPAALSLLLPGFDQWFEGQYASATFYSGMAYVGYWTYSYNSTQLSLEESSESDNWYDSDSDRLRRMYWGAQFTQTIGGLSAYHSFRSAVRSHQSSGAGRYDFLVHEETSGDLLLAPLKFQFLMRPTTFVPLGLLAAAFAIEIGQRDRDPGSSGLTTSKGVFSTAVSYNAGVGEEAIFRGWLMPVFRQSMGSDFWSNSLTAALFAAAHISADLEVPVAQFVMGWYWGWVTQKNDWRISEAIFQHVWWDVIALTAFYMTDTAAEITVPLINLSF